MTILIGKARSFWIFINDLVPPMKIHPWVDPGMDFFWNDSQDIFTNFIRYTDFMH